MPPIPPLLRLPERLIHLLLHLDDALGAVRFHLAAVHQGVGGADPGGGGEAPEAGRSSKMIIDRGDNLEIRSG